MILAFQHAVDGKRNVMQLLVNLSARAGGCDERVMDMLKLASAHETREGRAHTVSSAGVDVKAGA